MDLEKLSLCGKEWPNSLYLWWPKVVWILCLGVLGSFSFFYDRMCSFCGLMVDVSLVAEDDLKLSSLVVLDKESLLEKDFFK